MTTVLILLLLAADPNGEKRAQAALASAAVAEREAESAYETGEIDKVKADLKAMADDIQAADDGLKASGKTPGRSPRPYKFAEQKSQELLVRLNDFERRMDESEHNIIEAPKTKVQEIHDAWFDGIMSRKKQP